MTLHKRNYVLIKTFIFSSIVTKYEVEVGDMVIGEISGVNYETVINNLVYLEHLEKCRNTEDMRVSTIVYHCFRWGWY